MPSMELRNYLSELASIAALAKAANQTELYNQAKEAGKVRSEGKDYVVQDGDVILFKFNV